MNRKGFTLTELLATLVILGIIAGIVLVSSLSGLGKAKDDTEEIFIKTIKDAMNIYLDSDAKDLTYSDMVCSISKSHDTNVNIYKTSEITFNEIINSKFHPLTESDLINPANKDVKCSNSLNIPVSVYRDDDYVYYYKIEKEYFGCLNGTGVISNLPEGCNG